MCLIHSVHHYVLSILLSTSCSSVYCQSAIQVLSKRYYNVGCFRSDIAKRVPYEIMYLLYLAVYQYDVCYHTLVKSEQSSADEILGFDTISVLTN